MSGALHGVLPDDILLSPINCCAAWSLDADREFQRQQGRGQDVLLL